MRPITTLTGLPQLRRLCAPQSASFYVDQSFETCNLPVTIESIGIIDSSKAANRYAEHILENRENWPHLAMIKLWISGVFDRKHREREARIMEESDEEEADEWKQHFEVGNSIWEEAKSSGIKMRKMQHQEGWRKGSMSRR
jgi:hypothetical protein